MADQLVLPTGEIVKKSNALCRARWSIESVWEPRLVALLASKIHVEDKDFHVYEVHVSEILQRHSGQDYKDIENVVDKVMSRVLTVYDDDGWIKYNVFHRCRFRRADGMLELCFHPDLKPHYLELQRNFAQYDLMEFLMLPSIYSQRIFEILKSYSNLTEITLDLKELHEMLYTPESFRKDFRNFRIRVLEKAQKDISKTSLKYEWEPVKKGKAVIAVRFIFNKKAVAQIENKKKSKEIAQRQKNNNERFKEALACATKKKAAAQGCARKDKTADVCAVCSQFNMLNLTKEV